MAASVVSLLEPMPTAKALPRRGAFEPNPDPLYRRLTVYAQDPSIARYDGAETVLHVPWEPLPGCIRGALLRVDDHDATRQINHPLADLDHPNVLVRDGFAASTTEPRFAQQMVYALTLKTWERFERALGRQPTLRNGQLILRPHAGEFANAFYDPDEGSLNFGYFAAADGAPGRTQSGAQIKTALSHDIVVHEASHALIDGLRSHWLLPTNPDVLALHEGLCDLIALFSRFANRTLVERALHASAGQIETTTLFELARQFGQTLNAGSSSLRTGILDLQPLGSEVAASLNYSNQRATHARGSVLVSAVFEAFRVIYERRVRRDRELQQLVGAPAPRALVERFADEASRPPRQFLGLLIRAIDYTPPVDCTFGEYLRALITADTDADITDRYGYREALIAAFRRYGIPVSDVPDLSEESLLWRAPFSPMTLDPETRTNVLAIERHGAYVPQASKHKALALAAWLAQRTPTELHQLGIARDGEDLSDIGIHSVRMLRRVLPNRTIARELVVELIQRQHYADGLVNFGGATLIFDGDGEVRCAIAKHVGSARRATAQRDYLACEGARYRALMTQAEPHRFQLMAIKRELSLKLHHRGPPWC